VEELMIHVAAKHFRRIALISLATMLATAGTASAQLQLQPYVSGLTLPVGFVQDPGNPSIQYVVEQVGRVRTIVNGTLLSTPFLDVSSLISCCGEQGLLGLAFPPDYATSGRFYINYTNTAGNTVVARYLRSASNPLLANPASRFPMRWGAVSTEIVQPFANHNGGHIAFGPDGYLYIGMGDGGSANDPQNNAQNATSLLGKMLRIDVNVPSSDPNGYVVPPTNRWVNDSIVRHEIWAAGLRNPWKFSFDPPALGGYGSLIIGDVGQSDWEEIDYEGPGCQNHNYGWRDYEGQLPNPNPLVPADVPVISDSRFSSGPIVEHPHPVAISIIGGVVYRGAALRPSYWGRYFYGDLNGRIWSLVAFPFECGGMTDLIPPIEHTQELGGTAATGLLTAIGTDAAGEIYLVSYSTGSVLKMIDLLGARIRRQPTDFYGLHDRRPDLVWFNESTRHLATWHMGVIVEAGVLGGTQTPLGNVAKRGGELVSTPAVQPGWQFVGSFSERLNETELFFQSDSGQLGMWMFSGQVFQGGVLLNPAAVSDPLWRVRAVGDFNHDGHADLVWQYTPTGKVAFWLLNGNTAISYAIPSVSAPGPDWEIFGTGDSLLDGQLDLYWQHRPTGTLAVWRMLGTDFGSGVLLSQSPSDAGWRAVGVCDLDLDGSSDIIFQHVPTGNVAAWYLDGETFRVGTYLSPSNTGDANWKLVGPR
jgi:glucose/sorbosone dehydrogenase